MVTDIIDQLCEILNIKCFTVKEKSLNQEFNNFMDEKTNGPQELELEDLDQEN